MKKVFKSFVFAILLISPTTIHAQTTFTVDTAKPVADIQSTMYGIFYEDINFAADGGLYAEMIKNRSFEFTLPRTGWLEPNTTRTLLNPDSGIMNVIKSGQGANNNFARITVENSDNYKLINEGFRAMGIKKGETYNLTFEARQINGDINKVTATFIDPENDENYGSTTLDIAGGNWDEYSTTINPTQTVMKAQFQLTFEGTGTVDMDMISLFPENTWKDRPKGMRRDLVQLLADMEPGFLRFPGGCIVEGRNLDRRYQWKKTVGPIEEREVLINRWNTEFAHRLTPDYYQSFGLGFFEYFQVSEDIGAEPVPILSAGIACQFNTGEVVPMDELGPYIQDALDLIEFANGDTSTDWGNLRAEMGHPAPFNMKYIGIGNEQWGEVYIERYTAFQEAIKEKYPDIIIVSSVGPFPSGNSFDYAMKELKAMDAELIDEHYYRSPEWFLENADRYDSYDRNGPKIFAGEFAAHNVQTTSPDNANNWYTALTEAAFMTGLERNAEVVHMASYAPLFAHSEGWQWTPNLIWFNNLESFGTPNYYVQKLYSTNRGDKVLSLTVDDEPVIGQNQLYASASLDNENDELILKIANTSSDAQQIIVDLEGSLSVGDVKVITIKSDLEAENSFQEPTKIQPVESSFQADGEKLNLSMDANSFSVIRVTTVAL